KPKPTATPKPTAAPTPIPSGDKTVITKDTFKDWDSNNANIDKNVKKIEDDILAGTYIYSLYFCGDAPEMSANMFRDRALTAYYPINNPTWTDAKLKSYGGSWVTWAAWDPETGRIYGADLKKYGELRLRYKTVPYTGTAQKVKVYVRDKSYTGEPDWYLSEGTDYKVTYKNNINAGTATVTVTGIEESQWRGTLTATFKIVQANNNITVSNVKKNQSTRKQTFSLGAKALDKAKLTYKSNTRSVTVDKYGKVSIAANYTGEATITITAAATKNCKAAKKNVTVTVKPSAVSITKVVNIKTRKADIRWKKNSYATGYEVQYSTNKTFKSGVKTKVITKASTTKYTATSLAGKKTYYVRVRTYKTAGKKKLYSSWSAVKAVKITK
ncbi:MAG: fibronectin type III domain-containing protein, partial [Eubacteriales bacterium]|nr:fibronectin type III domain-containing protein [Eubacteriales bacterium]